MLQSIFRCHTEHFCPYEKTQPIVYNCINTWVAELRAFRGLILPELVRALKINNNNKDNDDNYEDN